MLSLRGLAVLLTSASLCLGAPSKDCAFKPKETIAPPRGWVKHSSPNADHNVVLRIGLPQPNFHVLEQHLYEVSDPDHERYGDHLSKEEVEELVAPHQESIDAVDAWLSSHGIAESDVTRSPAKDWVTLKIPVSLVEKMLDTKYHVWKHTSSDDYLVRTTSYSLPSDLHDHIDVIQPTTTFGRFKGAKSTFIFDDEPESSVSDATKSTLAPIVNAASGVTVDASCNTTITVTCLQQLYNAVGFKPKAKGNSIGITGYLEQFANIQDLQSFYADQRPDALNSSFKFISVKGGLNNQTLAEAGAEANLDVQFAFGISHPIPGTFYSTAGRPPFIPSVGTPTDTNEPYTDWLDFVLSHPNLPLAISSSYGDEEETVPESFARRACAGFAQLGVRGVSVMFSSGDGGVGDGDPNPATQECFTNDGRNTTKFIPGFPASCPFVTAVGGTQNINPEVAVSRFFSGGGFSNYFKQPTYQKVAVEKYLEALPKGLYKGLFNPEGRAFPDVAAQGDRFRIFLSGRPVSIGGTSASSPAFTGFVALLNDVRLQNGQSSLGFLNPLIYKNGGAFNDITIGHNAGCGTPGFNATAGWDPVTGFGTPNFGKLKGVVSSH
ncbi:peptidase S8/S53 domain-containing protein [Crucibulum laeve]|uniref:tripeptidyl-peptidase II n=1 Tax=Crucibulum laeve TaxID=68775 RepID=A0A5C3MHF7_9AGAR|nr:peptidase S8/S53 domain-containing protein [Crucibulum laeve]